MGRSQESFNKKDVKKKQEKKKQEKEKKKLERKEGEKSGKLEDMIAYVDENGRITSTPPDPTKKSVIETDDILISIPKKDFSEEPDIVRKGVVTYLNESKGFGFIKDSETQESIFVHVKNVLEEIKEGNAVTFEVQKGLKGLTATQVKVLRS
jgi:Cold shock proteins